MPSLTLGSQRDILVVQVLSERLNEVDELQLFRLEFFFIFSMRSDRTSDD